MKEIYNSVFWFRDLAKKIAKCSEQEMVEQMRKMSGSRTTINPSVFCKISIHFSLSSIFQALTKDDRKWSEIYPEINKVFGISELSSDAFQTVFFYQPEIFNTRFGRQGQDSKELQLLWKLFHEAVSGDLGR